MLQNLYRKQLKFLTMVVAGIVISGSAAARNQTVFVSNDFASCGMNLACPPLSPCESYDFNLSGFCDSFCFVGDPPSHACLGLVDADTSQGWELDGQFAAFLGVQGDAPDIVANFSVTGTRPTESQLDLSGSASLSSLPGIPFESGQFEVSVFRFSGDPTVFDGIQVPSVFSLVSLGLIDNEDVLFSQDFAFPSPPGGFVPFSFSVDVNGVPSDEIVIFGSHSGSVLSVPALSRLGIVLLALGTLLAAAWMLRTG